MLWLTLGPVLCALCGVAVSVPDNVRHVTAYLDAHCRELTTFLPPMCGAAALGPACCGLFRVVDFCSPACARGDVSVDSAALQLLMYDVDVCGALSLTTGATCQGPHALTLPCQRLHCLLNMMCFPFYNFACFHNDVSSSGGGTIRISSSHGEGAGPNLSAQGRDQELPSIVQDNCFELPELADGEMTGLINDDDSELRQCPLHPQPLNCSDVKTLKYRTIDGSCNNLDNPKWGKSFEPQKRLLPSQLEGGHLPRTQAVSGSSLPDPRQVSRAVSPMAVVLANVSNMVMAWGQFIDHDFTGTPVTKNGTKAIKCCGSIAEELKAENGGPCFAIQIASGDPIGRPCMEFVRSLPYTLPDGTLQEPREMINTLTSFLDGSAVYGNTQDVLDKLRGQHGLMKMGPNNSLPANPSGTCKKEREGDFCLMAGDHRVNVFVGLAALHTVFVREHNRIASTFSHLNPTWDDETIFQETRRIVSAEFQHVTYSEWLPLVVGDVTMTKYRLKEGDFQYDPNTNPNIANVFSTAAFRFGHSQVKQKVRIGSVLHELQNTLMRPGFALHQLADIIHGIVAAPTDVVDRFFADGLTTHMFETNASASNGLDLVAINIQRGRDHGLPAYNDWREFCGMTRIAGFDSPDMSVDLSAAYESVDDVDVFVGLVCEPPVPGSVVGPTLACLLGHQFHDIKFGDRFFYETQAPPERFTPDQLSEVKKGSLAKILCDNIPELKEIQRNVMMLPDSQHNPVEPCEKLPGIDLNYWRLP